MKKGKRSKKNRQTDISNNIIVAIAIITTIVL